MRGVWLGFYVLDNQERLDPDSLIPRYFMTGIEAPYFSVSAAQSVHGQGFVVLSYDEQRGLLDVSRVRRPTAIRDFLKTIDVLPEKILIDNASDNMESACKFYARTFDSLGYLRIRKEVWMKKSLKKECRAGNIFI
jgi:hypothetical protein